MNVSLNGWGNTVENFNPIKNFNAEKNVTKVTKKSKKRFKEKPTMHNDEINEETVEQIYDSQYTTSPTRDESKYGFLKHRDIFKSMNHENND